MTAVISTATCIVPGCCVYCSRCIVPVQLPMPKELHHADACLQESSWSPAQLHHLLFLSQHAQCLWHFSCMA